MKRFCGFVATFLVMLGLFSTGCARITGSDHSGSSGVVEKEPTLAVMPFHGVSEARNSGMIVADILANQLHAKEKYHIIAREVVLTRLAEQDNETLSPLEAGTLLGAPFLVTGRVTEYTYKTGVGETPAVGVTARLLDAATGKVLWSGTRTGIGGGNWLLEDSLSELTVNVCHELADSITSYMLKHSSILMDFTLSSKEMAKKP